MGKSNIEWTEHTWNTITGCSQPQDCAVRDHCYASVMAHRMAGRYGYPADNPMTPAFHEDKLDEPRRRSKPTVYFVGSMADMFGDNIPAEWIERVLKVTQENPQHIYMFLTKNPKRYKEFEGKFGHTCALGTTVNRSVDLGRLRILLNETEAPMFSFISFEPLYERMKNLWKHANLSKISLFIIGAQSKPDIQPQCDWVWEICKIADQDGIYVFMKNNLKASTRRQEFPYCYCPKIDDWIPVRKCKIQECSSLGCNRRIPREG